MKISTLFTLPVYSGEEDIRRVSVLYNTQNFVLVTITVLFAMAVVGRHWNSVAILVPMFVITLSTRWLAHTGRLGLASSIFLGSLVVATAIELAFSQGLHDITLVIFPLLMILASMLVGPRGYWATVVASILLVEFLVLAEYLGWLTNRASHLARLSDLIAVPVMFGLAAWLVRLLASQMLSNLARAREAAGRYAALAEASRRRAEHVEVLNRVSSAITAGLDLNQVLENLYCRVSEVVPADAFYVALYDDATGFLTFPIFYDLGQPVYLDPNDVHERPGLAGEVIRRRATLYVPDLRSPESQANYQIVVISGEESCTYLGVPMFLQDRVIGLMSVQSSQVDAFAEDQIALMEALATQAAIAIENARLYTQASEALQREQRLNQIMHTISRSLDWPVVLQRITELTAQTLDADMARLALVSSDGKVITDVHDYKTPAAQFGVILPYGYGITWEVLQTRQSVRVTHYPAHPQALPELVEAGVKEMLASPILVATGLPLPGEMDQENTLPLAQTQPGQEAACLGVILVSTCDPLRQFDERDQALLETIAIQAGVTIQNARLVAALRQRETILEAATYVAETFLELPDWRTGIQSVLMRVGQLIGCSQISMFENRVNPAGQAVAVLRYAWLTGRKENGGWLVASQLPPDHPYAGELPLERPGWERWLQRMRRAEPFYGSLATLLPEEADQIKAIGACSILCVPIHLRENWWGEIRLEDANGMRDWSPAEIDGLRIVAGVLGAASARREAEQAVRQLNAELEQRVQERTAEFQVANRELETFAYSVAHDLRAPLRSIDGYSKLLQDDYGSLLPDEARFYLDNARQAAQRMGQLIDDLLRLSRVTRAEMHRTLVNLSQVAGEVVEWLFRQDPQRAVEVTIEPGLWVQGDAELLRLALENLLGNAWKFTSRSPQAHIELGTLRRQGDRVYFIRDNGAGFDMKYSHQLFKAFHRLHAGHDFDGSGVGLATVQRIIHRHGGHIWATSAVDQGATFYFTIK